MNLCAGFGTVQAQEKVRNWFPKPFQAFGVCGIRGASGLPVAMAPTTSAAANRPAMLADVWRGAVGHSSASHDGIYGRIVYLRRDTDADKAMLGDASRRVIFVADGSSWAGRNFRCSAREILLRNGVQADWVETEVANGTKFKLVLFDATEEAVWPADWEGVQRAVEEFHPTAAKKISKHWNIITSSSWEELEARAGGVSFEALAEAEGPMTEDRYLQADDSPATARRFLASTLSLNKLFQGTGYTYDERQAGQEATAEFLTPNRPLRSIPPAQIIDLPP